MSETIQTKQCLKCKQFKPLSEFRKDKTYKNGRRSECKICHSENVKKYSQTVKGKIVRNLYNKSENCEVARKRFENSEKGKIARNRSVSKYRKQHPKRIKARKIVEYAIKVGKLPHPNTLLCHYCNKQATQYHHWHGYEPEHWLDVVPACRFCDIKDHKKVS